MDTASIEELLVKLTGDATSYLKMLTDSDKATEIVTKSISTASEKIMGYGKSILGFGQQVVSTISSLKGLSWFKGGVDSAIAAEQAQIRLKGTIKGTADQVAATMAEYSRWAKTISDTTTLSEGEAKALLQQAEAFGATGKAAETAAKNAIGLAALKGGDASQYIRITSSLAQGVMPMRLQAIFPELKKIKDESEKLARAQELVSQSFGIETEMANSAGGIMKRLENAYKALRKEIGTIILEALKPMLEIQMNVVKWFKQLPKEIKTAVAVAVLLSMAFVSIAGAIALAGTLFNTYFGGIGIVIGLIVTALTSVILTLGGVGNTFQLIKEKAEQAWEWLKPVRKDLELFWQTLMDLGNQVWESIKKAALNAWSYIVGDTQVNWDKVRDIILEVLFMLEFGITHLQQVFEFSWTAIKYGAVAFANYVLKNCFMLLLTGTGGILLALFMLWKTVFDKIYEYGIKMMLELMKVQTTLVMNWQKILAGTLDPAKLINMSLKLGITFTPEMKGIQSQYMNALEQQLKKEYDAQKNALNESYAEFKKKRLEQLGIDPEKAKEAGKEDGEKYTSGMADAMKTLDAVIYGSLESITRYLDYREKLFGKGESGKLHADNTGGVSGQIIQGGNPGGLTGNDTQVDRTVINLLTDIRDGIKILVGKQPAVNVGPANI